MREAVEQFRWPLLSVGQSSGRASSSPVPAAVAPTTGHAGLIDGAVSGLGSAQQ